VGVNRTGRDPELAYPGRSLIVDPRGNRVAELDERPGVLQAHVEHSEVDDYRRQFPALADLRPEFLGPLP
jgi:predicted amidohydrolase